MFFILVTATLLLLTTPTQAAESTVDFGFFTLTLPDGYSDHHKYGDDSLVGYITIKGKSYKIDYDNFAWGGAPKKLSDVPKNILDNLIYYERIQDAPVTTEITALFIPDDPDHQHIIVTLSVLGPEAGFTIRLNTKSDVKDAIEVLRAIRVTKAKDANM